MADWNERYRQGEQTSEEPHPLVVRFAATFDPGRALDVACGAGRHSIWLAERGWQVTAVDYSSVAIDILRQRAIVKNVTIDSRIADLESHEFAIEPAAYDLIVVCNYLQRDLFRVIKDGVRIGGVIIAVIAMIDDDPAIKPMNPTFLLRPEELRAEFEDWELIWNSERKSQGRRATAELVAKRPAN